MKRVSNFKILSVSLATAIALCAVGAAGATHLGALSLTSDKGVTHLRLAADAQVKYSDFSLADPDRIVVDCWDAEGTTAIPSFTSDIVKSVNLVKIAGDHGTTTRMIVSLSRPSEYTVMSKDGALEVAIQPTAAKASESLTAGSSARGARVSLDVQGADVKTVIRTLSEVSGRNIVPAKDVKGEVSMALKNVPWRDALESLCKSQNLGYKEENGIIRVAPLELIQNEELNQRTAERRAEELLPLETRSVHVSFANVEELKVPLASILSKRGQVNADPRTSTLLITDIAERAEAAEAMARQLDGRTPQITITAKLIDVDAGSSRDLGITWNTAKLSGTINIEPRLNEPTGGTGTIQIGTVSPDDNVFQMKLDALERTKKANIISNPTITTVDNREAKILVGQKIPLIVADAAGNALTQLTTIGIQLKVTPHLNSDNKITMDVHPEVSDLAAQATVQGGVIINTSEADTRVMVDDGQTAVIGGLIRTNESTFRSGVPVLKDIPIIGALFSSSNKTSQKRELMILITPHLVTGTPGK